jgi:predicted DNA-binding protein with PD1-like motif
MKVYAQGPVWVVSLEPGESVGDGLLEVARQHEWMAAAVWGIGALRDPLIGYYIVEEKRYIQMQLSGDWELVACHGNLSTREGEPFWHLHVVLSDREGQTRGGHLFEARVGGAGEFVVLPLPHPMVRRKDDRTGLYLLM